MTTLIWLGVSTLGCGWSLALVSLFGEASHLSAASASIALTGYVCLAAGLQVQSRLQAKPTFMVLGVSAGFVFPAAWFASDVLTTNEFFRNACAATVVALAGIALGLALRRSEGNLPLAEASSLGRRTIIATTLPLIPHLTAVSLLLQGMRLSGSVARNWDPQDVAAAGYYTLILGLAYATIQGVHGLLSVTLQRSEASSFDRCLRMYALAYGGLGVAASLGVAIFIETPCRQLFAGMAAPIPREALALTAAPALLCTYFFLSSLLVRTRSTKAVAAVSLLATSTYFLASQVFDDPAQKATLYAIAVAVMPIAALPLVARSWVLPRHHHPTLLIPLLGLAPSVVVYLCTSA